MKKYSHYLAWGLTAVGVVCATLLIYDIVLGESSVFAFFSRLTTILMPIIFGAVMAYLLAPVVNWFERNVFKLDRGADVKKSKQSVKWVRYIAILLAWLAVAAVMYLMLRILLPELYKSILQLIANVDGYYQTVLNWIFGILEDNPNFSQRAVELFNEYYHDAIDWLTGKLVPQIEVAIQAVTGGVVGLLSFTYNMLVGIIVSVYILVSKEGFGATGAKMAYTFLEEKKAALVIRGVKAVDRIFSGFVLGKLLDSLIIGIICFICTSLFKFPYAPLVSLVVGITNVIPYFGPFLGAIPSAFLILLDSPIQCLYFVVFIFALQQFDGNILGPRILGDSTGLSSFWVIVSITFFGGLWGVMGMFIGVPLFACIYTAVRTYSAYKLKERGLPTDTASYKRHKPEQAEKEETN